MLQLRICIVLEYWYQRNCALNVRKGHPIMPRSCMFNVHLPFEKSMLYHHYIVKGEIPWDVLVGEH